MEYNCQICDKVFSASMSSKRKYCSRGCYNKKQHLFPHGFKLGHKSGMTGKHQPESQKQKMSIALKGHPFWGGEKARLTQFKKGQCGISHQYAGTKTQFKKGNISWNKGKKMSEEAREKMSLAKLNNPTRYWLNKKRPGISGERSPYWKGGITPINEKIRRSIEYKRWREAVYKRDGWACRLCGKKGKRLHADHIKSFAGYPELRFVIDNGRTLCISCHKTTENYGRPKSKK